MAPSADSPPFVHLSVPNRSLGAAGRRWVLGAIAATTLGVAAGATAARSVAGDAFRGPRGRAAGLAFRVVRSHDADFERLEIGEHEVQAGGARRAARHALRGAPAVGARGVEGARARVARCGLAYAGRTVPLGRMLSDEGRRQLAAELRGRLPVTAN